MTGEAEVAGDEIPHDPIDHASTMCPICDVTWPCPERLRQRAITKECHGVLRQWGWGPESTATSPRNRSRWVQVLMPHTYDGWQIFVGYGVDAPVAEIVLPNGSVAASTANLTASWLEGAMP